MIAAENNHPQLFSYLISLDPSMVRERDLNGRNAVMRLVESGAASMFETVMTLCRDWRAELLTERTKGHQQFGGTMLHLTAQTDHAALLRVVIKAYKECVDEHCLE